MHRCQLYFRNLVSYYSLQTAWGRTAPAPTPLARPAPGVRRHRPDALGTRGGPSCRWAGIKGENRAIFGTTA